MGTFFRTAMAGGDVDYTTASGETSRQKNRRHNMEEGDEPFILLNSMALKSLAGDFSLHPGDE